MVSEEFMKKFQKQEKIEVILQGSDTPDKTPIGFGFLQPILPGYEKKSTFVSVEKLFQALDIEKKLREVYNVEEKEGSVKYTGDFTENGQQNLANILGKEVEFRVCLGEGYSFVAGTLKPKPENA